VTKVIAVQGNLKKIRDGIENKGYKVVDLENTDEIIDAMVYSAVQNDNISSFTGRSFPGQNLSLGSNSAFVLMINADENTEEEIISLLEDI